ncbi:MAG TPA: class I SAM-dependent methyltransferase [Leptolyngbyaceae cyanobacterium]
MTKWYKEDLAYIHDIGFSSYALKSAPTILAMLAQQSVKDGLIVDLGCGSGLSAGEFTKAGYSVLGIDISEDMIALAQCRVPTAEFQVGSLLKADIPNCVAVTVIGEVVNYLFDPDNTTQALGQLFYRVYHALIPGGLFVFDIAEPNQVVLGSPTRGFTEDKDWYVLVEKSETPEHILTRRIITFRQVGETYRRDDEVHQQRLYKAEELVGELNRIGFEVKIMDSYGSLRLPAGSIAIAASKPSAVLEQRIAGAP